MRRGQSSSILSRWPTRRYTRPMPRRPVLTSTSTCRCDSRRLPIGHSPTTRYIEEGPANSSVSSQLHTYPLHREDNKASSLLSEEAVMRGFEWKTVLAAAIAASGVFLAAGAQAHDDDERRWKHHHHGRWQHEPERRIVHERRVVYERPVYVQRQPVYIAPAPVMMAPMYSQPVDPSLNFNFQIPLR